MKSIYILGSGGFAREVYSLIKAVGGYQVRAFVDVEAKSPIELRHQSIPVISEATFERDGADAVAAIGVGDPLLIAKLSKRFVSWTFPNLIHPKAIVDMDELSFGRGNIITAGVIFTTCITVGDFNIFNLSCTVGHDAVIGSCNVINPTVNISGGVVIGDRNLLGVGATILQYKTIGNDVVAGASSLLTKDAEDGSVMIGVPAKKMNV